MTFKSIREQLYIPNTEDLAIKMVPEHLTFRVDPENPNLVMTDLSWMVQLGILLMERRVDQEITFNYLTEAIVKATSIVDTSSLRRFYHDVLNEQTIEAMNQEMVKMDEERKAEGKATFRELILHHLGLADFSDKL